MHLFVLRERKPQVIAFWQTTLFKALTYREGPFFDNKRRDEFYFSRTLFTISGHATVCPFNVSLMPRLGPSGSPPGPNLLQPKLNADGLGLSA